MGTTSLYGNGGAGAGWGRVVAVAGCGRVVNFVIWGRGGGQNLEASGDDLKMYTHTHTYIYIYIYIYICIYIRIVPCDTVSPPCCAINSFASSAGRVRLPWPLSPNTVM